MENLVVSDISRGTKGEVKQVRISRKVRSRIVKRVDRTGKPRIVQIMRELNPELSRKAAEHAYDLVTMAINGWLRAYTRDFPFGLHAKLLLTDCFSVNICWIDGEHRGSFNFPAIWIQTSGKVRASIRRMRLRSYSEWKAGQESRTSATA